jgi:hypothetical protein
MLRAGSQGSGVPSPQIGDGHVNEMSSGERDRRDPSERRRLIAALQGDSRANDDARRLLLTAPTLVVIMLVVYGTDRAVWMRVPVAYLLPMLLVYPVLLSALLSLRGRAILPKRVFALGAGLTAGGVVVEMLATALRAPAVGRGANPIARALLDSGQSPTFVAWHAIIAQALFAAFVCLLWAAFLKHRLTVLLSARRDGSSGRLAFVKAALGGGKLSWRQFLLPLKSSELPSSFHLAWLLMAALMGTGPAFAYLGLCWLWRGGFAHASVAVLLALTSGIASYLAWLSVEAGKRPPQFEGV